MKKTIKISQHQWKEIGIQNKWIISKKSPTEHGFMDECMEENKDKDDPGAYCAAIVDKAKGTTKWRKGPKK